METRRVKDEERQEHHDGGGMERTCARGTSQQAGLEGVECDGDRRAKHRP